MFIENSGKQADVNWLETAKSCEHALISSSKSVCEVAESWKKIGFYYNMASRQSYSLEDFKKIRALAAEAYEKAGNFFKQENSLDSQGKSSECFALAEYMRSWFASNSQEKDKILNKCTDLSLEALEKYKKAKDNLDYGRTCNLFSQCLLDRVYIATVEKDKTKFVQKGINTSEDAISVFTELEEKNDLLLAFSLATLQSWYYANIGEKENIRKEYTQKCLDYSKKAYDLSAEVDNSYFRASALWARALATLTFTADLESSLKTAREMWDVSLAINDNYFKGIASYLLAFATDLMIPGEANPTKKKRLYEDIIRYSENSIKSLVPLGQDGAIAEVYLVYPQSYSSLAREYALNSKEKLALSKIAVRIGEKGLEHALRSGSTDAMASNLHSLSKAYHYYSSLEPRKHEKPELLKSSLGYRREYIKLVKEAFVSNFWILGLGLIYAAQTQTAMATLETDDEKKVGFLRNAISDMSQGVPLCEKWIDSIGSKTVPTMVATVAGYEDKYGGILKENYLLTEDNSNLTKAIEVYDVAAENFKKVDLPSRVAESYWKIASNLDFLGKYDKAAENFGKAFGGYKVAAKKIEQFSDFYIDYSNYMKAWSAVENAKLSHINNDYPSAMRNYQKASSLLGQSKTWNYLSLNFYAWSILEQAEDFSRQDNSKKSIKSFENATKYLRESKKNLETEIERINRSDEKSLVVNLVEASEARETFSLARVAIEEAKILDKKGKHLLSSDKYGDAAKLFQKISANYPEQIRWEAKPLVFLCQAWEKMKLGEAKNSPILFEEASDLFKKAKEYATSEEAGLLALAHSSFCKALESGAEFEITRSKAIYKETKRHLEAAANYYLRAGFEAFSEYTKATRNLFDAYVFMDDAKKETDPAKEAKHFLMAEKVLGVSLDSFSKARHEEKAALVERLLSKAKEERELAVSLSEVFHAPGVTSSTGSFTTLSPSYEMAVGLERFEHADIQAKIVLPVEEISVGEDLKLKIQLINVGKEPVLLAKIENLLPASFQMVRVPDGFVFENLQLTIMGKQLAPLKAEEITLTLRSFKSGDFEFRPKIVCVDETGEELIFHVEPATYSVSDAILSGRIRTGYKDLDNLLMGGLPEEYGIILTSPSNDERALLIKRFLETGIKNGETTFYITSEVGAVKELADEFQSNFYLFVCNPRADVMIKSLPNVYKIKGVDSLTDIDISLIKAFRSLDRSNTSPRRACIEVVSDVLLQHRAVITRKWLSGLLPDLKSRGFTTLAIVNPQMHPTEEVYAILGLFDGEIRVTERDTQKGLEKVLRIRKLYNQRYMESELIVTRQKIES
jgi:KaiC/GvpD/RAD55 family RecA-like ATPase